ncbi:hypothetical protein CRG98_034783 [Punica granatum]|uniref:Uncharacterized protein n=1 Tax=Punica granatum TaxID=22663 RepID=A0A2I0ILE5_PUNGR|nr:hypothetical protein CRG98_034783 [Punica granatum]
MASGVYTIHALDDLTQGLLALVIGRKAEVRFTDHLHLLCIDRFPHGHDQKFHLRVEHLGSRAMIRYDGRRGGGLDGASGPNITWAEALFSSGPSLCVPAPFASKVMVQITRSKQGPPPLKTRSIAVLRGA